MASIHKRFQAAEGSMVSKVLGLAGPSGSGKDEVADAAARFGYQKWKVADQIRVEFAEFLEFALRQAAHIEGLPDHFEDVVAAYKAAIWNKPTSPEARVGLQWWGTDLRRADDPDYWTRDMAKILSTGEQFVVSDVRIPLERDIIRSIGGEVWWIDRPGLQTVGLVGHATENSLGPEDCDRVLKNDSTLEVLTQKVDFIFRFC
jgi:hypothetical protein